MYAKAGPKWSSSKPFLLFSVSLSLSFYFSSSLSISNPKISYFTIPLGIRAYPNPTLKCPRTATRSSSNDKGMLT